MDMHRIAVALKHFLISTPLSGYQFEQELIEEKKTYSNILRKIEEAING